MLQTLKIWTSRNLYVFSPLHTLYENFLKISKNWHTKRQGPKKKYTLSIILQLGGFILVPSTLLVSNKGSFIP